MTNFHDIGRLGSDPEIQYFASGRSKVSFSLAIDSADRDNGKPKTVWLPCEAWSNADGKGVGMIILEYVRKGQQLYVSGSLKQDEWIDKNTGAKRQQIKLVVSEVKLLSQPKQITEERSEETALEEANEAQEITTEVVTKAKKSKANVYASTASKGKAMAYADGQEPELDEIPF